MDKQSYKEEMSKLISENSELKEKVKELETKLYFKDRNMMLELTMENSELRDRLIELGECDEIVENRGRKYLVSDIVKDENQLELFED